MKILQKLTALLLCAMAAIPAAGCEINPDSMMISGASDFAQGKDEENYGLVNSGQLLDDLIKKFSGSFPQPQPQQMSDDDFDKKKQQMQQQTTQSATQPTTTDDDEDGTQSATEATEPSTAVKQEVVADYDDLKDLFLQAYTNTDEYISFTADPGYTFDEDSLNKILDELTRDYPIETTCIESWQWGWQGNEYLIEISYGISVTELRAMKEATPKLARDAAATIDTNGLSEREIVSAVNEYLCDLVTYTAGSEPFPWPSHTAYLALSEGDAVCDGYSRAAKLMLNDLGIKAQVIVGTCTDGGGHAWNLVNVDGSWYHLDVTWNDGSQSRQDYFLVNDSYMHVSRTWDATMYPAVP